MFAGVSPTLKIYLLVPAALVLLSILGCVNSAAQQSDSAISPAPSELASNEIPTAPVVVDGIQLFSVRGLSVIPAEKRAQGIAERIRTVAEDRNFQTNNLRLVNTEYGTQILAGDRVILNVYEEDARIESVARGVLAAAYLQRIKEAIDSFRADRKYELLIRHIIYAVVATLVFIVGVFLLVKLERRLHALLEHLLKEKIHGVEIQALQILHARHVWNLLFGSLKFIAMAIVFVWAYATLYYILSLFPWTRGLSKNLLTFLLNPVRTIASNILITIPDLIFLAVLGVVTHYALKLIRLVFSAIEGGAIKLPSFDPEWAKPTYRITRFFVNVFALVIAFPYIPGSGTQAFKGLSLFIGVIFSLGSTALIGNLISGYSLTYRRVFRRGDRVKIGNQIGYVERYGMMVTYLHTIKNEVIAIPNSQIVNAEVINFTSLAHTSGLILHTKVGIGYETPWRQVEAMLIESAAQTPGLLKEPSPFVQQTELGDFAITYEINAYCDKPQEIEQIYSYLHQNILDVFNEYGVQIMTPAYRMDPPQAKVVPKDQWYAPPARRENGAEVDDFHPRE